MKLKTFFTLEKNLNNFILTGDEFNHAIKVFRQKKGDLINIITNDDYIYTCKITLIESNKAFCEIIEKKINPSNPKFSLTVYQSVLKADKMEYLVQKLAEVGASTFIPVLTENVVKTEIKEERLIKIAKESSKQSGRSKDINIQPLIKLKDVINKISGYNLFLVAHEKENINTITSTMCDIQCENVAILIGPEGGLSDSEVSMLSDNGAKIIGLGCRVLRAETAALVISSIVLEKMGEFNL